MYIKTHVIILLLTYWTMLDHKKKVVGLERFGEDGNLYLKKYLYILSNIIESKLNF